MNDVFNLASSMKKFYTYFESIISRYRFITVVAASSSMLLAGCTTDITEYKRQVESQSFDIKTYFSGDLIAYGIVQDYTQKVTRRFCVELNGTWDKSKGILAEKFFFQDGEISYRNWNLTKVSEKHYQGTAEDVEGVAKGRLSGFAFQFTYDLLLAVENDTYSVSMDDWMYQIDEYRVINHTTMSKLGITVAKISIFFDKETPHQQCQ
ncbi:DUF3833 domain-containing protein [Thalassotalea atypica]|uniref:DUF3833 domain-containing protein n=1 Tax=Thalassotalea atypica TaxID=2054316 RepID=UPI0025728782|nr:DUF3833 domain-containing protein [Thalassotalea atypica]